MSIQFFWAEGDWRIGSNKVKSGRLHGDGDFMEYSSLGWDCKGLGQAMSEMPGKPYGKGIPFSGVWEVVMKVGSYFIRFLKS